MDQETEPYGFIWIASEICYYLGLVSAALFIPTLSLILWMMSLIDKADPNYWYLLIAWIVAVLLFITGIGLKNLNFWLKEKPG